MLKINALSKRFDKIRALDDVSLSVPAGTITAFLGPNGAGKTTAIRIMSGLMEPDAGDVEICGHSISLDPFSAKSKLGYLPDQPMIYDYFTGIDYLNFTMDIFRTPKSERAGRVEHLIDAFDMRPSMNEITGGYSLGQKRKLSLIAALCHKPKLLLLDEPTLGFDPKAIRELGRIMKEFAAAGGSILFSTHILEMAEKLCDFSVIISKGKIIATGTIAELRQKSGRDGSLEDIFLELTS